MVPLCHYSIQWTDCLDKAGATKKMNLFAFLLEKILSKPSLILPHTLAKWHHDDRWCKIFAEAIGESNQQLFFDRVISLGGLKAWRLYTCPSVAKQPRPSFQKLLSLRCISRHQVWNTCDITFGTGWQKDRTIGKKNVHGVLFWDVVLTWRWWLWCNICWKHLVVWFEVNAAATCA